MQHRNKDWIKENGRNVFLCLLILFFLAGMGSWLLLKRPDVYSFSERRTLARKRELTMEGLETGEFMENFEAYALDQFPLRDRFRSIKAVTEHYILQKKDSNGIYVRDGQLSKIEYPLNQELLTRSTERMRYVYDKYVKEKNITPYFAIVPDKNYYLAQENEVLTLDYDALYERVLAETNYMTYIEIKDLLALTDYYPTDTHWRQECIGDVAERIGEGMNIPVQSLKQNASGYKIQILDIPFYGVYYGQAALPVKPDTIRYLTNEAIENCIVTSYDTGKPVVKAVYDVDKAAGKDAYELFLTGANALLTIENPTAATEKELIVFRDSFGSSLMPFFIEDYQKITVIDLRYIQADMLGSFVEFDDQEVLFLYSTLMLNNGLGGGN